MQKIVYPIISLVLLLSGASAFAAYPAPTIAKSAMVVSAQHYATQVGADILQQGGNAIDAAVAVGSTP